MLKTKKFVSLCLAVLFICNIPLYANATDDFSIPQPIPHDPVSELIESLDPSVFSGAYYNEAQELCLGTPDVNTLQELLNTQYSSLADEFKLVPAKYSLKQLTEAKNKLLNARETYKISAVGFDTKNNGLAVFVPNPKSRSTSDYSQITEIPIVLVSDSFLNFSESPASLSIENGDELTEDELTNDSSNTASPRLTIGAGAWLNRKSTGDRWSSLGAIAITDDSNRTVGIVTCGHGWNSNSSAYYNGTLIGTNASIRNSGDTDATFFKKTNSLTWGGYRNGNKVDLIGIPAVNQRIYMLGANGTQSGYVEYTDVSGVVDNTAFDDLFCFNFRPVRGDSGAAIIATGSRGDILIGLNKCAWYYNDDHSLDDDFPWGAGCKSYNIENSLGILLAN